MQCEFLGKQLTSDNKVATKRAQKDKDAEFERVRQALGISEAQLAKSTSDPWQAHHNKYKIERRMKKIVVPGKKFRLKLGGSFSRKSHQDASSAFTVDTPYTIALLGGSKALFDDVMRTKNVLAEYERKGHKLTMVSLLDFTCRYTSSAADRSATFEHGLNVQLHPYQRQSLRWMLDEEQHDVGFYRHFFAEGRFADDSPFWFSAMLDRLIVDGELPRAHGGFLCEEMGLGKTIISLALIRCNRPGRDRSYSSKRALRVSHREQVTKTRVDNSDPENPRLVEYTEEHKHYKTKATLIVAPCSLVGQWEKEMAEKCAKKLKYKVCVCEVHLLC